MTQSSSVIPLWKSREELLHEQAQIEADFKSELSALEYVLNTTVVPILRDRERLAKLDGDDQSSLAKSDNRLLIKQRALHPNFDLGTILTLAKSDLAKSVLSANNTAAQALLGALRKRNRRLLGLYAVGKRSEPFMWREESTSSEAAVPPIPDDGSPLVKGGIVMVAPLDWLPRQRGFPGRLTVFTEGEAEQLEAEGWTRNKSA